MSRSKKTSKNRRISKSRISDTMKQTNGFLQMEMRLSNKISDSRKKIGSMNAGTDGFIILIEENKVSVMEGRLNTIRSKRIGLKSKLLSQLDKNNSFLKGFNSN